MTDKFTPASQPRVVRDLDAIIADPVGINLHGRVRMLKPITSIEFMKFMEQWNSFTVWKDEAEATAEAVIKRLHCLLSPIIEDLTEDDVGKMVNVQVAALINIIFETISGKIFHPVNDDGLKKKMRKTLVDFPQASQLLN